MSQTLNSIYANVWVERKQREFKGDHRLQKLCLMLKLSIDGGDVNHSKKCQENVKSHTRRQCDHLIGCMRQETNDI